MNWFFLVFTLICLLLVIWGVLRAGLPVKKFIMLLVAWLGLLIFLSFKGIIGDFSTFPPRIVLVLLIPFSIIIWFTLSSQSTIYLKKIPPEWIIRLQSFRIIVELFLWWAFLDQLIPLQMTFEGRNFDILVGLTAPLVAVLWVKPSTIQTAPIIIWNIFGLALLFNIVIIAVLSMPTPMRYFMNAPPNTLVATFPWVLLPGILVALALALHLFSIKQMLLIRKENRQNSHA